MKKKPLNSILIAKTIVSTIIVIFLIARGNWNQIYANVQLLSLDFVVFALIYYAFCQLLSCIKWQIILKSMGYSISIKILLSSYFAGMFLNTFLPGSVGGDIYRIYKVNKKVQNSELAFSSVFLERVTGLVALLVIALLSVFPAFEIIECWDILLLLMLCIGMLLGIIYLIINPTLLMLTESLLKKLCLQSFTRRLTSIQISLRKFGNNCKMLFLSIGLSILIQLLIVYYYYLIAQNLKIQISYLQLLIFTAIIVSITILPISLGGLGVKEGLFSYLFHRVGLTIEQALVLSMTVTILGLLLSLPGGLVLSLESAGIGEIKQK